MAARRLPPIQFLHECFSYDPETGLFVWKARPDHHFDAPNIAKAWNSRMAGEEAFCSLDTRGYLRTEVVHEGARLRLAAGRVAFKLVTGDEPEMVDHRDLNTKNNRFSNLRASDRFGNRHNAPGSRLHLLPKGVAFERGFFRASGHSRGRKVSLGSYRTPAEAHAAYCAWARPIHGEFFNPGPAKPSVFD